MQKKEWSVSDLIEGSNIFPQVYNCNCTSRIDGLAVIQASTNAEFGTRSEDRRSPTNPTISFSMSWPDAVRLAVQITQMAMAVGEPIPEGVFIKGMTQ